MKCCITGLKEQLNKAKGNAEQYKIIAETVEKNLREQNETMEQFKETTEAKLNEAVEGNVHGVDTCFRIISA